MMNPSAIALAVIFAIVCWAPPLVSTPARATR